MDPPLSVRGICLERRDAGGEAGEITAELCRRAANVGVIIKKQIFDVRCCVADDLLCYFRVGARGEIREGEEGLEDWEEVARL